MRINPLAPQDHIYLWTTSRRGKWRVCNTLTRVEADITSLLGTQAPTELCCKKCRRMQASSHNQAGGGVRGMGGGDDSDGAVILCSASAVRYRVAAISSTI